MNADEAVRHQLFFQRGQPIRATTFAHNPFGIGARAYVLAAGGIENARLLLLSRSRRPAGLGNDHDLVGADEELTGMARNLLLALEKKLAVAHHPQPDVAWQRVHPAAEGATARKRSGK